MNVVRANKVFVSRLKDTSLRTKIRVVENASEVRDYLDTALFQAEEALGLDNFKLLPYVLIAGIENQLLYPLATEFSSFHPRLWEVMKTLHKKSNGSKETIALSEFELNAASIVVGSQLEGIIFAGTSNDHQNRDLSIPIVGEPYGTHPLAEASVYVNGVMVKAFRRMPLDEQIKGQLTSGYARLVTLGPPDDIVGILRGRYRFNETWELK